MPAATQADTRPTRSHRWLVSAVKTASEPQPALPFNRANRSRPASLTPTAPTRTASVAAR